LIFLCQLFQYRTIKGQEVQVSTGGCPSYLLTKSVNAPTLTVRTSRSTGLISSSAARLLKDWRGTLHADCQKQLIAQTDYISTTLHSRVTCMDGTVRLTDRHSAMHSACSDAGATGQGVALSTQFSLEVGTGGTRGAQMPAATQSAKTTEFSCFFVKAFSFPCTFMLLQLLTYYGRPV